MLLVCMRLCATQDNKTVIIKHSLQGLMIAFITMMNGSGIHLSWVT